LFKKLLTPKEFERGVFSLFDKMAISHYLEVYISSSKIDAAFFLNLKDDNDRDTILNVIKNKDIISEMWGPPAGKK
jgi:hypothetical protein